MCEKKNGKARVRVEHYRYPSGYHAPILVRYFRGYGFKLPDFNGHEPTNKGGYTAAFVDIDGNRYGAGAKCMLIDHFSYRLGRTIAINKLRNKLRAKNLTHRVAW